MTTNSNRKRTIFLTLSILVSLILSACATPTAEVIEKVVTQIVKETVVVEGTPLIVEKAVTQIVEKVVTATPVPQRELVVALAADPPTLDPLADASSATVNSVKHIFSSLVERDPDDMSIVPELVESWEIVDDTTYVFKLRKGLRFHNGEELTTSDVKFSFDRMLEPEFISMGKYVETLIESIEVIDEYTVQFNLLTPYAPFLARMPTFHIVPEDYINAVGSEEFARHPIGSGPYKLVERVHGDHITLEAFEDYWGGAPRIKRVVLKPIPESSTRVAALLAGEADIIQNVPPEDIPKLEQEEDVRVVTGDDYRFYFYGMNSANPPFDDVRIRQAVSYAIDWDSICELFEGYATRVPLPALPNDWGYAEYADDLMQYTYDYNPDRARELLAEAGFPDGFETTIELGTGRYPKTEEVAQAASAQLAEVGIKAEVVVYEWGVFYTDIYNGVQVKGLYAGSMGNPIFDPDHLMGVHFDPDRRSYFFNTPELTEMIHRGQVTVDNAERIEIYRGIMKRILEEAPYAWGYTLMQVHGIRADVDWKPRTDTRIFALEASFIGK